MNNLILIAVSLGFLGSLHCVGMCGALMVYNFSNLKSTKFGIKFFIYHVFRIMAYGLLGTMFGQIGFISNLIGIQKVISLISGIILIYIAFTYFFPIKLKILSDINVYSWLNSLFSFSSSSYYRYALSGFANGLLPCGFSFIAVTFAVTTYSMIYGFLFMLIFGIATIPTLFIVSVLAQRMYSNNIVSKFVMPFLSLIVGILLIVRGMNLDIPYISPNYSVSDKKVLIECHKP